MTTSKGTKFAGAQHNWPNHSCYSGSHEQIQSATPLIH